MKKLRTALALSALALGGAVVPAIAADIVPCQLAGPAGTSSIVQVDLPHGSPSLALRVTTAAPDSAQTMGRSGSWHLATQVAVLRASNGRLVAHRAVQFGSTPRSAVATTSGKDMRVDAPATPAPFRHVGASVPAYLPAGRYLLVAYGSDGSPVLPNPGWAAEAAFGVPVRCVPLHTTATLLDRDQTSFSGGTQLTAPGIGIGTGTRMTWQPRQHFVVGLADTGTQAAGDAHLTGVLPDRRKVEVRNALQPFSGGPGTYQFSAEWTGAFPLVLVCALAFTT